MKIHKAFKTDDYKNIYVTFKNYISLGVFLQKMWRRKRRKRKLWRTKTVEKKKKKLCLFTRKLNDRGRKQKQKHSQIAHALFTTIRLFLR